MAFRGRIVRISQLIADSIVGAVITGGSITGATITATAAQLTDSTLTNPAASGGTITGSTIVGAVIETALSGARWVIDAIGDAQTMVAYSGLAAETSPAFIQVQQIASRISSVLLSSASMQNGLPAGGSTGVASIELTAQGIGVAPGGFAGINMRTSSRGGVSINGTTAIKALDWGAASFTFSAVTVVTQTIAHGLARTPAAVLLVPQGTSLLCGGVLGSVDSNSFVGYLREVNGNPFTGTVAAYWFAIA